jgi:hypothetical protein
MNSLSALKTGLVWCSAFRQIRRLIQKHCPKHPSNSKITGKSSFPHNPHNSFNGNILNGGLVQVVEMVSPLWGCTTHQRAAKALPINRQDHPLDKMEKRFTKRSLLEKANPEVCLLRF